MDEDYFFYFQVKVIYHMLHLKQLIFVSFSVYCFASQTLISV